MKLHSRSIATGIIISLVVATLVASCSHKYDALEYAYKVAGPNRGELEKVMNHYKDDPEKLAAARFLIENMPGHYSYKRTREIDEYYEIALQLTKSGLTPKEQRDSLLYLSDNRFFGLDQDIIQDARIITADYLIQNIDKAFDVWKNERWAKHITFDEFCEWILPYKCVELQSFDCWRDTMRQTFWWNIAHMDYDDESYDSPFRAVNTIRSEISWRIKPVGMYNRSGFPMRSASTLAHMTFGSCADYVNLGVLTFRSYGIPVIIEETPSWGRYRAGHTWYTLLNDNGEEMRSEWDISSTPGGPFFPHQRIPKVYRQQYAINRERVPYHNRSVYQYPFSIFSHDVTDRYFNTTDVTISIRKNVKLVEDFAYIATFNGHSSEWTLIDFGEVKKGKVTFQKMGRNILYIALGYDGKNLAPLSWPFIIHKDGSIEYIRPDYTNTESVDVRRKYYSSENVVAMRKRMLGGCIQASEPVGNNAQVVIRQTWNTIAIVFVELSQLFACHLGIIDIVGLVLLHQTVAFCLDRIVTLVDREIEWGFQVRMCPGLASFYLEIHIGTTGHQPHDDNCRSDDKSRTDENIAPRKVVFYIETTHFPVIFTFMDAKIQKTLNFQH